MRPTSITLRSAGSIILAFTLVFGLVVTSPSPAAAASATTTLSPTSGVPGTSVTVSGSNFAPRSRGTVTFGATQVARFKSSPSGSFKVTFAVPSNAAEGSTTVTSTAGISSATSPFTTTSTTTTTSSTSTTSTSTTSTTSSTTTTTTAPPPTSSGFIGSSGRQLTLSGAPYRFTGINAYHLSTDYTVNYGCGEGNTAAQIDDFFASLRPNSMVRVWAFQQLAWDKNTNSLNFTTFDRIVAAAEKRGQKLIFALGNQWSGCGEARKTEAWYAGGYRQISHNGTSVDIQTVKLSFWDYIGQVVPRYANSPAIGMWEPINEPAADDGKGGCSSTAPTTLRTFFDSVGGEIHRLDPNHLVSSGLQGSGQCGSRNAEYETLHQSPGLDVASYHDYGYDDAPMPGDQWNGLQVRLDQMARINKPLFIGEVGIKSRDGVSGCLSTSDRKAKYRAKMDAQFQAGIAGFLPWVWVKPNTRTSCTDDYGFDVEHTQDSTLTLLRDYSL